MSPRRLISFFVVAFALSAIACKGVDLTAIKAQAMGLVDKYKPQLKSGLTTVESLLGRAKGLPAEIPGVGDLVSKLTGQQENLTKLQGLLDGLPGQVETAVKTGKEDELKKLITTIETDVGGGLKAADGVLAEAQKGVEGAEGEAKTLAVKAAAGSLGEKLVAPLTAATAKLDALLEKAKALPQDAAGVADFVKAIEADKTAATEATTKLGTYVVAADTALQAKDLAGAQKAIDTATTETDAVNQKLLADLKAFEAKLAELAGAAPAPAPAPEAFAKALSTGFEVKGNGNGVESGLIAFVDDAAKAVDKTTWFNFDRLTFASGSTNLEMETSKEQLTNIVEILKAYPNAKLKIGGYTDNDGPADANQKISQKRAEAVVKALVDLGVDAGRLEAEGYGPEFPVCPANDTPECKAQNRRIAVRVTAK